MRPLLKKILDPPLGSFCNKRTLLAPTSVTAEAPGVLGDGLRCLALTRMSRRLSAAAKG